MSTRPLLVIGNRNYSSWSLRPYALAQHLGVELDVLRLVLDTPAFHAEIGRYSPTGRVPVLVDGDLAVVESIAILEYLSELAGGLGWPTERAARARARSLAAEMHAGFSTLRSRCPMNIRAHDRKVDLDPALLRDVQRIDAIFAAHEPGHWLFGAYSAADAMYLPVAFRCRTYGPLPLSAAAQAYVDRATHDPLIAAWVAAAAQEPEFIDHEEVGA